MTLLIKHNSITTTFISGILATSMEEMEEKVLLWNKKRKNREILIVYLLTYGINSAVKTIF